MVATSEFNGARNTFGCVLVVRFCSTTAFYLLSTIVAWFVYSRNQQALDLAQVALVLFIPMAVMTPVVGLIIDRLNRGVVLSIALALQLFAMLMTALAAMNSTDNAALFACLAVVSVLRSVEATVLATLDGALSVKMPSTERAMAASALATYAAHIAGPAIGGALFALSMKLAFLSAPAFVTSAALLSLALHKIKSEKRNSRIAYWDGIREAASDRVLVIAILIYCVAVFFAGLGGTLPIFAQLVFNANPTEFGYLRAAPGIGALMAGMFLMRYAHSGNSGAMMMISAACFGIVTVAFSFNTSIILAIVLLVLGGVAINTCLVYRSSIINVRCNDAVRGAVSAIQGLAVAAAYQLGEAQSAVVAHLLGPESAALIGGSVCLTICVIVSIKCAEVFKASTNRGCDQK